MKINSISLLIFIQLAFFSLAIPKERTDKNVPKLTVVVVIDQFAYHYIPKLQKYFSGGLKYLLEHGVIYQKAYHPHGVPETTPGHNGIATGTCPKDHGAIGNDWVGLNGERITYASDPDFPCLTCVECSRGYSSRKTKVDGLSDQFIFKAKSNCARKVYALSLKSYPAISMAGKLGKAFWLDQGSGEFTSSTAYFKSLPEWVVEFNQLKNAEKLRQEIWELMYPEDSAQYDFPFARNYDYAGSKRPMIGSNTDKIISELSPEKYYMFMKSPQSSKHLLNFAQNCLDVNFMPDKNNKMILWISLSNLDLECHLYGPHCIETIDLIYHIDKQLKNFIDYLNKNVGEKNYLFVLTADHGICPIPEIAKQQGFYMAKRIIAKELIEKINNIVKEKHGVKDLVVYFEPTYFRVNRKTLEAAHDGDKKKIYKTIKNYLRTVEGIKNVWTFDELANSTFEPQQLENFYKNQLYKGRSGDIICQPEPYCQITKYATGTSHLSPYDYDTHVPLIIYQSGRFENKKINEKVWMQQLPVALAKILNVGLPSASTYDPLPGLKI